MPFFLGKALPENMTDKVCQKTLLTVYEETDFHSEQIHLSSHDVFTISSYW